MGFKPYLKDQLASFSALTLGLVISPVKIVPDVTYNAFGGTLNLVQSMLRLLLSLKWSTKYLSISFWAV